MTVFANPMAIERPMHKPGFTVRSLLLFAALAAPAGIAEADGVADFYKGRSVSIIIGYSVGGGYDAYARLLARYIGRHIPGEPSIVPQQMTGAGSLRAANYIFSVAPKDGSVLGTFSRSTGIDCAAIGSGRVRQPEVHLARQHDRRRHHLRDLEYFADKDLERFSQ